MQTLASKLVSGGKIIACNCPFCVDAGKAPDTKFHLHIVRGKYVYCYRCSFKRSYNWFIKRYKTTVTEGVTTRHNTLESDVNFDSFLARNTRSLPVKASGVYERGAINYLKGRKVTSSLAYALNIQLGIDGMHGRVVFVDKVNKYFMGRSIYPSVIPKTLNPPSNFPRPLMYLREENYDTLYLVEGVFDMVPFLRSGKKVCAILGKDMSGTQMGMLVTKRVNNIILALDPDAFTSAVSLAKRIGDNVPFVNIGVLVYDDGEDRDPSELDTEIFDVTSVNWVRIMNKEKLPL